MAWLRIPAMAMLLCCFGVFEGGDARDNGLGRLPPRGWNTWCTGASCWQADAAVKHSSLHDNCSEALVKSVAAEMVSNGMLAAGYNRINLDDCWGATADEYPGGAYRSPYRWDPQRFPSGIPALADWLHERGFLFGLYTASGEQTCSSGGRRGSVPGSDGHFEADAATFAAWGVDYVKLDWCIKTGNMPTPEVTALRQNRTDQMAAAMNATGRPMWLTFHCVHQPGKGHQSSPSFAGWCAEDGNSWRIGPDHHDNWGSLDEVIQVLGGQAEHGRPGRWNDPDFLMTGGAGCDQYTPGRRCPGMTEAEYRTEYSLWSIAAASMILSTDPRNMTTFMRATLLHPEMLAIHADELGVSGGLVATHTTPADGCSVDDYCQVWARPLADGGWAMALYNRNNATATITGQFVSLPVAGGAAARGRGAGGGAAGGQQALPASLAVRDVWAGKDLGTFTGGYTAKDIPPHGTVVLKLTKPAPRSGGGD